MTSTCHANKSAPLSFLDKPESQIIRRLRFVFDLLFFELSFGFMPERPPWPSGFPAASHSYGRAP